MVAAGPGEGGPQSGREVTLIPGYDIPMQIMAEILADNNVLHQSPSRSDNDYLQSHSVTFPTYLG